MNDLSEEHLKQMTLDTYNNSAKELAEYFQGIGPRTKDIKIALSLAQVNDSARIVELGCGDGRDAAEIIEHSAFFEGIDNSRGMVEIAKKHVPEGSFVCKDMMLYEFPRKLDVVFAFASLLHLSKEEVKKLCGQVRRALRPGGVFYISLKYRPQYEKDIKQDKYGERLFFFYTPEMIEQLAGLGFVMASKDYQTIGTTKWFTIVLKKVLKNEN